MSNFVTISAHVETIENTTTGRKSEDSLYSAVMGNTLLALVADGTTQQAITPDCLQHLLDSYEEGITPGRYAAYMIRNTTARMFAATPDIPLRRILLAANRQIYDDIAPIYNELVRQAESYAGSDNYPPGSNSRLIRCLLPTTCATLIRLNMQTQRLEMAHVGDTVLLAYDEENRARKLTPNQVDQHEIRRIKDAHALQKPMKLAHFQDVLGKPQITEAITHQRLFFNYEDEAGAPDTHHGIGIINGLFALEHYIFEATYSLDNIEALLLASDGFFYPAPLDESEQDRQTKLERMYAVIRKHKLTGHIRELRTLEESDQTLDRYPRFKVHDDATAIYITIEREAKHTPIL